jgi:branched-chain amino acid transport system ATP-binding protein
MTLKLDNITVSFGDLKAVDQLSFEVESGEIFGIAGPNGAGKTTVFNRITGIYHGPGDIIFDGDAIGKFMPYQICHRGVARTFQVPRVFSSLPVIENVKVGAHFGMNSKTDEDKHIKEVIEFVGLTGKENETGANLKLLDKKLTMLAAALATEPKLLLLDEPTAGLSPAETEEFVGIFKTINTELGLAIIIIEHFMKVLTELSDRLLILENGRKLCIDSPYEIARNKKVIECYLGGEYAQS